MGTTPTTSQQLSPDISSALDELMFYLEPSKNRQNRSDVKFEAVKAVSKGMADRTQALTLIEKGFLKPLLRIASGCSVAIELAKEDNSNSSTTTNVLLEIASSTLALQTILYATSSTEEISNLCVETLLDLKAIPRLVELILDLPSDIKKLSKSSKKIINTTFSILANLTRTERGSLELVGSTLPEEAVYNNKKEIIRPEDKEAEKAKQKLMMENNNEMYEHTRIKPSMEL